MVAVQPYYTSPLALAKTIASMAFLYGRKVALNMVVGSTPGELRQVHDGLDHDARFERMDEYLDVVRRLLANETPLDHSGRYYAYSGLDHFAVAMAEDLLPEIFIAGSSAKAEELSLRHGAISVTNPEPIDLFAGHAERIHAGARVGVRLGLIARESTEEAWAAAHTYFPVSRAAQINVKLNGRASDSVWRRNLAKLSARETHDEVYWLGALLAGGTHSPFLVGAYDQVAEYLARYLRCGVTQLILASPAAEYVSNARLLTRARSVAALVQTR